MRRPAWEITGVKKFTDVDYEFDRMNVRKVAASAWQFLELIDMHEATGESDGARYHCEVKYVDLAALAPSVIRSAVDSCGSPEYATDPRAVAEMCCRYGAAAPLWQDAGGNRRELMRAGYRAADDLLDTSALADAMSRPVNALGSTADEYMRGDLDAAVSRGVARGDASSLLVAKLQDACTLACPSCQGTGGIIGDGTFTPGRNCVTCNGTGRVVQTIGGLMPARKEAQP